MNIAPRRGSRLLLALIPFVLIAFVYIVGSAERRAANPEDKLLPPVSEMVESIGRLAFEEDRRSGEIVLWADTAASMQRLLMGLAIATLIGLAFGLALGLIPVAGAGLGAFVAVLSMIPPMAILPILFIVFGLGELSKVVLIVFGIAPFLIRDLALSVESLPREQLIKAQALAADLGLGYRIFLVRRYLSMDVILPYVAWITLLAYLMDFALAWLARRGFAWAYAGRTG